MKSLPVLCLIVATGMAQATPVRFISAHYFTSALAEFDGSLAGPTDASSPPDPLPLLSDASLADAAGHAFATAIADNGLLAATVDLDSTDPVASGVAIAGFTASFIGGTGRLDLDIDFSSLLDSGGDAIALSRLFVALSSDGVTLLDDTFDLGSVLSYRFALAPGSINLFDITLIGTADLPGAGAASAFTLASTEFRLEAIPVSMPGSLSLLAGAAGCLIAMAARGRDSSSLAS